jgi:hypothetical protein
VRQDGTATKFDVINESTSKKIVPNSDWVEDLAPDQTSFHPNYDSLSRGVQMYYRT